MAFMLSCWSFSSKKVWISGQSFKKVSLQMVLWYPKIVHVHHLWSKKYNGFCTLCVAIVPLALLAFFARRRILHLLIFKWLKLSFAYDCSCSWGWGTPCRAAEEIWAKNALLTSKSKGVSYTVFSALKWINYNFYIFYFRKNWFSRENHIFFSLAGVFLKCPKLT